MPFSPKSLLWSNLTDSLNRQGSHNVSPDIDLGKKSKPRADECISLKLLYPSSFSYLTFIEQMMSLNKWWLRERREVTDRLWDTCREQGTLSEALGLRFSQQMGMRHADRMKSMRNSIKHMGTWERRSSWAVVRSSGEQKALGREEGRIC